VFTQPKLSLLLPKSLQNKKSEKSGKRITCQKNKYHLPVVVVAVVVVVVVVTVVKTNSLERFLSIYDNYLIGSPLHSKEITSYHCHSLK